MLSIVGFVLKNWKLFAVAAAAAAVFVWFEVQQHNAFTQGQQTAVEKVERANEHAQVAADRAAKTVDDCYAAGRDWDRARGVCVDPAR